MPMGTQCALLVTDLCLCCYQRDFILSLSDNNQDQDNPYSKQMVSQIYTIEHQLNKANTFDTEAVFSN